ncbi:MAG: LTA synthase family protein [Planctomycetes bacterium]|nr:LTA synthase family protein [Planctomycetota bacterium]
MTDTCREDNKIRVLSSAKGLLVGRAVAIERRLRSVWISALICLVVFVGFRAGLLLARIDALRGEDLSEITRCFLLGMRYDAMPIGYLLLPLALVVSLSRREAFASARFRRFVTAYATGVVALVITIEIIGAAFFLFFGLRLNWMAMYYLQYPREVASHIWKNYPVWLFVPVMAGLIYAGYRVMRRIIWAGRRPANGALPFAGRAFGAAILVTLCILACRGGLDHHPLRRGSAYISYNNLVNQLTLNNFFTFVNAARLRLGDNGRESSWYPFPPKAEATAVAVSMLYQDGRDVSAGDARNALWRRTSTDGIPADYNVVVILMESMSSAHVGILGNSPSYTPNFDALCHKGIYFDRLYAVGARTCRGVVGVLCGHPDIAGVTLLKRKETGKFMTLPSVFKARGYETTFIYGGDPRFDNMEEFFQTRGIDRFIGQEQIGKDKAGSWGVPDEMIFNRAHEEFSRLSRKGKKFFSFILTVSNHSPYVVPAGRTKLDPAKTEEAKINNAYRYADWALGEFFRKVEKSNYFKRTVFLLVADHGSHLDRREILDVPGYRIPALIYAGGIETPIAAPRRISTVCSQADLAPTLLSLLGGSFEHCFLGRDVLSLKSGEGFAFFHEDDRMGMVQGERALVLPPLSDAIMFKISPDGKVFERIRTRYVNPREMHDLEMQLLSYYGTARDLYLRRAYCLPADAAKAATRTTAPHR